MYRLTLRILHTLLVLHLALMSVGSAETAQKASQEKGVGAQSSPAFIFHNKLETDFGLNIHFSRKENVVGLRQIGNGPAYEEVKESYDFGMLIFNPGVAYYWRNVSLKIQPRLSFSYSHFIGAPKFRLSEGRPSLLVGYVFPLTSSLYLSAAVGIYSVVYARADWQNVSNQWGITLEPSLKIRLFERTFLNIGLSGQKDIQNIFEKGVARPDFTLSLNIAFSVLFDLSASKDNSGGVR